MDQDVIQLVSHKLLKFQVQSADISDIDGTVYKWQLLIELVLGIAGRYPIKASKVLHLETAIDQYRKRVGPFKDVIDELIAVLPDVFKGVPQKEVQNLAMAIATREATQTYVFPRTLYQLLTQRKPEHRRLLIAITGAPQEVAEPFCKRHGFDVVVGSQYYVDENGIYTGERDIDSGIDKGKVIDTLVRECGLDLDGSIGLGDSETDIPIFDRVTYRFAVNPNVPLVEHIRQHPDKQIVYVRDGQKSGVQLFRANTSGHFVEVCPFDVLPGDLGHQFHDLPGIGSPIVPG